MRPPSLLVPALVFAWALTGVPSTRADDPPAPQVTQFSPQGTVKRVRQVSALFSEAMVPLGDPRAAAPFDITCPEAGTGRWVDTRQWVYDFARDLPAGVRCTFQLRPGLQGLAGRAFTTAPVFTFSTGGPAVRSSTPREGSEWIDEEQAFILMLDAEPTEASLLQHVGFSIEGVPQRVGLRVLTGAAREAIVKTRYTPGPRGTVVVIQPVQRFPSKSRVILVWGKGVTSISGVATEEDQKLHFKVRDPFEAVFQCERENRNAGCVPITPMTLRFSAPVPTALAHGVLLRGPRGRQWAPEIENPAAESVHELTFKGPFPEKAQFRVELPADFKDDAGRALVNAARFPLAVRTEAFPPLAKFSARFGIVEAQGDPALPVTLRNVEPELLAKMVSVSGAPQGMLEWIQGRIFRVPPDRAAEILPWLRRVGSADRETSLFAGTDADRPPAKPFTLPKPGGTQPMEVVGIPLKQPGFYVVELQSARLGASLLGKPKPMYVPAAALVTNLSVHFKWGRGGSLVWVTSLDRALPVPEARIQIHDCAGKVLWSGWTDGQGLAPAGPLPDRSKLERCATSPRYYVEGLGGLEGGLFITAQVGDDLSFVHSSWDQGIEGWRFRLPTYDYYGPTIAHTVLDRALFRAGETVHMKHVLRRQVARGLQLVADDERPARALVRHLGSDETYELPLAWDGDGIAESVWSIPKGAKLGSYEVVLAGGSPRGEAVAARFQVQEFRVPLMKAVLRPPTGALIGASAFPLDMSVQYLAGGAAARQSVTLRAQVGPKRVPPFEGFEEFTFGNGPLKEGIVRRGTRAWEFYYEEEEAGEAEGDSRPRRRVGAAPAVHQREQLTLDAAGTARATISRLPHAATPQEVLAELEFHDPNGEVQTASTRVSLWPAAYVIGIRPEAWAASREALKAQIAVLDVVGKPASGVAVEVSVLERKFYSYRKRLVGGFYAYEHVEEVRRVGELCRGTTDAKGLMPCEGKPPADGRLVLQATAVDNAGRQTAANQEVWVAGSDEWWFDVRDSDRIDLLPEQRRYEPGDTARLQVRMPFREATALVTVEREGVLDARVVPLLGREPVIEVPIKGAYAPNVFVSALVVRGRATGVQPTALVDLGRPAFKLGITELKVGWQSHELKVSVSSDRTVYRTREKALVRISVRAADRQPLPPGAEVTVAAVDEGLLELAPNGSWNLLEAMMRRRTYGVQTATAQSHVVGKRHFGLKALPQGGGGGRQPTRELFDTLLFWQGRVRLDAKGEALVEVPLNDSITAFRIVAVATAGTSLFGTGATSIRSTQDLMVLPGIAPVAREGDRMRSEVTLRNATDRPMEVTVGGRVAELPDSLASRGMTLAPGEAKTVDWVIAVPTGVSSLRYEVEAAERGGAADRVAVTQRVVPAVPLRVYQATLERWDGPLRQPVERPADGLVGRGGVFVSLRPTLVEGLTGVRDWMTAYPYRCLEQQVSRAVALRDERIWREIAATLPAHQDADGLLKYFPTMQDGSEVLTAYLLSLLQEAGWQLPTEVQARAEAGLQKFIRGAILRRSGLATADLSIRKLAGVEALSRYGQVDPELLGSIVIEPNLWPTSAVLDWWSVLHRMPGVPNREARLKEAEQIIRARLNYQGTVMGFSTEASDRLWWLMVSSDVNALRLILQLLETNQWKDDVPRLLRGVLGRQRRGAWDLTVANAWGVLAVEKFSRAYESTPVSGATTATLAGSAERVDWGQSPRGGTVFFPWPPRREEVTVDHAGTGHAWVTVQAQAAIPLAMPLSRGYRITKRVTPIEARLPGQWSRGDLVRVRLEIEAQSDMTWVVVNDPIPAGASHLGSGLARQSRIARQGEDRKGWAWPAFEERGFEAFRAYYAFVPKGTFTVEYTVRLNQPGTFQLPTTRVEALYSPEMFGELPNAAVEVQP